MAERLGTGLQSRLHGFESRRHLAGQLNSLLGAIGAAVARFPDTDEVTGSIPVSRTEIPRTSGVFSFAGRGAGYHDGMAHLVLTVAGSDRAGLVKALADVIAEHGGNWERSELSELAGVFAGVVLVSVDDAQAEAFTSALSRLDGLLRVTAQSGSAASEASGTPLTFTVLGNDRPGIVRDVTAVLEEKALSIDRFESRTLEAPMAGGVLFEASAVVRVPEGADAASLTAALERLAGEIQVDLTVSGG